MPTLLALPLEIVYSIVANLAASQEDFDNFSDDYEPDGSLYCLAVTCTSLRDICLPKLYEVVNFISGYRRDTLRRKLSLLRTLATNPELASYVKRIIFESSFYLTHPIDGRVVISEDDVAMYNGILEDSVDMSRVAPLLGQVRGTDSYDRGVADGIGVVLACVALARVPNITSAVFYCCDNELPSFLHRSFPHLETFALWTRGSHLDTHIEYAQGMLDSCPNVRRLVDRSITGRPGSASFPSIRELALVHSRVPDDDVASLPTAFPALERLSYVDSDASFLGGQVMAAPRKFSEALLGLRRTLTHLELGADSVAVTLDMVSRQEGDLGHQLMTSLAAMQVLESIRLPARYIYRHDDKGKEYDGAQYGPEMTLVNFLPRSVRCLYLQGLLPCRVFDSLALAQSAPRKFPNLKRVTFPDLEKSMREMVRFTYQENGISCSFEEADLEMDACNGRCM